MRRNKRTERICHEGLTLLTERVLARMGAEGAEIRRRLQLFYQKRRDPEERERYESSQKK